MNILKQIAHMRTLEPYQNAIMNILVSGLITLVTFVIGGLITITALLSNQATVPFTGVALLLVTIIGLAYIIYNMLILAKTFAKTATHVSDYVNKVRKDFTEGTRKDVTQWMQP